MFETRYTCGSGLYLPAGELLYLLTFPGRRGGEPRHNPFSIDIHQVWSAEFAGLHTVEPGLT